MSRSYYAIFGKDPMFMRVTRKNNRKFDKAKAEQADYVFGVAKGFVVSVYKNMKWNYVEFDGVLNQRVVFVGDEVENSPYLDFIWGNT